MKLQKRLSRKYKNKEYYKYIITLPGNDVTKSGFREGDELIINTKKGEIKITK